MSRVYIGTEGWGTIWNGDGAYLALAPAISVTVKNRDGTNATHYSARTGGSSSTSSITTSATGTIERWIDEGEYTLTVDGDTYDVEAISGGGVAVIKEAPLNAKNPPAGTDPVAWDGTTDDTAALQAIGALLPQTGTVARMGGEIILPRGRGSVHGLDVEDLYNVVIRGHGGGYGATEILTPSTGSTAVISAKRSKGLRLEGFAVTSTEAGFTGKLVDLDGSVPDPTTLFALRDMRFTAVIQSGSAVLGVAAENGLGGLIETCYFTGGKAHIRGRTTASGSTFSNAMSIGGRCFFDNADVAAILNPYQWTVREATFEPLRNGDAGAILCEAAIPAYLLAVRDCWTGDSTMFGSGIWYHVHGTALSFEGGIMESGSDGVRLRSGETTNGLSMKGVYLNGLTNGLNLNGIGVDSAEVGPNVWGTVTNKIVAGGGFFGTPSSIVDVDTVMGRTASTNFQLNQNLLLNSDTNNSVYWGSALDTRLYRNPSTTKTLRTDNPFTLATYTTAGRPTAGDVPAGTIIYVSDAAAGSRLQIQHGGAWVGVG
jgi:hypothetical protein